MAGTFTSYSFGAVAVTIDGRAITGFWEGDDVVMVERQADNITPVTGADGSSTASISANDSAIITIKLQPNSPAHRVLNNKYQQNRSGRLSRFSVSIRDTSNNEGGSASECVIQRRPNTSLGENATVREWTIFAHRWVENVMSNELVA